MATQQAGEFINDGYRAFYSNWQYNVSAGGYITLDSILSNNAALSFSTPTMTVTVVGANFEVNLIGQSVVISAATVSGNNGTFTITGVPSATTLTYTNSSGATQTQGVTVNIPAMLNGSGTNSNTYYSNVIFSAVAGGFAAFNYPGGGGIFTSYTIHYHKRAFSTTLSQYVEWDTTYPDGAYPGGGTIHPSNGIILYSWVTTP